MPSVTLTGRFLHADQTPMTGWVTIVPSVQVKDTDDNVVVPDSPVKAVLDASGRFSIGLLPTDAPGLSPTGWTYVLTPVLDRRAHPPVPFLLPGSPDPADWSAITPAVPQPPVIQYFPVGGGTMTGTLDLAGDPPLHIGAGAGDGKVLTSDPSGHASWSPAASGAVDSVNGRVGAVVLDAADVGADASGAASTAVTAHDAATDPHTDRVYAAGLVTSEAAARTAGDALQLAKAQNLADLPNASTARTNLGLGSAATAPVDTTAADIQPLGTRSAGSTGKVGDAGHVHEMPRLDQVVAPTGPVGLNSQKLTAVADGTASTDAATVGQLPTELPPAGAASGDLGGSFPAPTVTGTHLSAPLPVAQGGTGAATQGAALTSLGADAAGSAAAAQTAAEAYTDTAVSGRVPATRQVASGTGLTGGGDLSADRTLAVVYGTSGTTAAAGNDSRLSDARTPTAHASTHGSGGSDPVTPAAIGAPPATRQVTAGTGLTGGGDLSADRTLAVSFGSAAGTSAQGNDARLSDARTPTVHAATHAAAGSDPVTPAAIGAPPTSRQVLAGTGLTGGGDLTADRTLTVAYGTTGTTATVGDDARVTGAAQKASNLSDLASTATAAANLGIPDVSALVPGAARLPGWVKASNVVTEFQSGHGWTSNGTGATFNLNDTAAGNFISGTQAASVTTAGTGAQANIRKFAGVVPDTTNKVVRLRLKCDDITHLNELDFYLGTSSLAANYKWSFYVQGGSTYITSGDWVTVTLGFADATTTGSPARSGLTDAELQVWDDNTGNTVSVHLQSVELISDGGNIFPNGVVSICFDDSYATPRDLGAWSKLDSYGFPATVMSISDILGAGNRISMADIKTRVDRFGWESAAHAWTDADHTSTYTGLTAAQLEADLRAQRASLLANGVRSSDGTAYPLGNFGKTSDGQSTLDLARRYFSYARTTHSRTTETWPPADPYRLRAYSGISSFAGGISATTITNKITAVKNSRGWLILVFHKIASSPAATTEITIADFNTIVDAINTAGIPVATISDVLRQHAVEPPDYPNGGVPSDNGLAAWTFPPELCNSGGNAPTTGSVFLSQVKLTAPATLSKIYCYVTNAGTSLGNCYLGLYDSLGNLVASTADQSASWQSTGIKTISFTASYTAQPGRYWIGVLVGSGSPTCSLAQSPAGGGLINLNNLNLTAANYRSASTGASLTALPASFTPSALATQSRIYWLGLGT